VRRAEEIMEGRPMSVSLDKISMTKNLFKRALLEAVSLGES